MLDEISERLDEKLHCRECQQYFDADSKKPRFLRCMHSICEECGRKQLLQSSEITCCQCTLKTSVLSTNVSSLPVNEDMRDLALFLMPDEVSGNLETTNVPLLLKTTRDEVQALKFVNRNYANTYFGGNTAPPPGSDFLVGGGGGGSSSVANGGARPRTTLLTYGDGPVTTGGSPGRGDQGSGFSTWHSFVTKDPRRGGSSAGDGRNVDVDYDFSLPGRSPSSEYPRGGAGWHAGLGSGTVTEQRILGASATPPEGQQLPLAQHVNSAVHAANVTSELSREFHHGDPVPIEVDRGDYLFGSDGAGSSRSRGHPHYHGEGAGGSLDDLHALEAQANVKVFKKEWGRGEDPRLPNSRRDLNLGDGTLGRRGLGGYEDGSQGQGNQQPYREDERADNGEAGCYEDSEAPLDFVGKLITSKNMATYRDLEDRGLDDATASIEEKLRCVQCCEYFDAEERRPRFLGCHHSICQACAACWLVESNVIKCRACRARTELPAGSDASFLPANDYVRDWALFLSRSVFNGQLRIMNIPRLLANLRNVIESSSLRCSDFGLGKDDNDNDNGDAAGRGSRRVNPVLAKYNLEVARLRSSEWEDLCPICQQKFGDGSSYDDNAYMSKRAVVRWRCGHCLHHHCAVHLAVKNPNKRMMKCSVCNRVVFGTLTGDQPDGGWMIIRREIQGSSESLPGFPDTDTIVIEYHFTDGIQGANHPAPGKPYKARSGFPRTTYLPLTPKGYEVLCMMKIAFEHRLIFTISKSVSKDSKSDCLIWNENIKQKTKRFDFNKGWGYPDANYLQIVTKQLEALGITADDIPKNPGFALGIGFEI